MSFVDAGAYDNVLVLFKHLITVEDMAVPVAAMNSLVRQLHQSGASTWMQLEQELDRTIQQLQSFSDDDLGGCARIAMTSGCDLFMKYVTRAFNLENKDFLSCKAELLRRGEAFAGMSLNARSVIAHLGSSFIADNCTVLVHGTSRVVNGLVLKAAESKQFNIIVTESRPDSSGLRTAELFSSRGIPTRVILDSGVGAAMEGVDLCLVGSEGVMENGGIINKIGTYQIAIIAHALKRPFYVAVESYKFARIYPLSQRDVRDLSSRSRHAGPGGELEDAQVDFTPAQLITLLFTDLGVLTPAAVSDELIRLYQ